MLDEVVRGRTAAAAFCDMAAKHFPAASVPLGKAAEAYRDEVATAEQTFGDFIPFRWDNAKREAWGSTATRRVAAEGIAEMFKSEAVAVAAIKKALRVMVETGPRR